MGNRFTQKMIARATESRWTKLFLCTSLLQALTVMILEGRVYQHNNQEYMRFQVRSDSNTLDTDCNIKPSLVRLNHIMLENAVFMAFQLFQISFCVNVVYNQNSIQLIAITVVNFACAAFGIVQIFETQIWRRRLTSELTTCEAIRDLPSESVFVYEVPLVAAMLTFAVAMAFLGFKLYLDFGWNVFKKIGADLRMQGIFRTMLIFVMLLKLDIFFMLALSVMVIYLFLNTAVVVGISTATSYRFHIGVTILIIPMFFVAYRSLRKEWKFGSIAFLLFCLIVVADFGLILKFSVDSVEGQWYFWICWVSLSIILSLLTMIYASLCLRNFGKGLAVHIDKSESSANAQPLSVLGPPKRWAIDDEEEMGEENHVR